MNYEFVTSVAALAKGYIWLYCSGTSITKIDISKEIMYCYL